MALPSILIAVIVTDELENNLWALELLMKFDRSEGGVKEDDSRDADLGKVRERM